MEDLTALGRALAALRSLQGRSQAEVATATGLSVEQVADAERGVVPLPVRERLASRYGLDARSLDDGLAVPSDADESFTTFLLHGPTQDFDSRDLQVFDRALRAARFFGAGSPAGRQGLDQRLVFVPMRPAGPEPRDAAQQGYRLARQVREKLGLGGHPIGDIRALLEDRFGVLVLVDNLSTTDLRAASVLDADRASAAAVLAHDDESRQRNPRLARVYLAHELCHLLFDPTTPGRVQIALDERPQQSGRPSLGATSLSALLEARAKGFAAEFLIPRMGVVELLGARLAPESARDPAQKMIARVQSHFKTPWEIAVWHLRNLDFIDTNLVGEMLDAVPRTAGSDRSTLPRAGEAPGCVSRIRGADVLEARDRYPSETPAFVSEARRAAREAVRRSTDKLLSDIYATAERGDVFEATDTLVAQIDARLCSGELIRVEDVLDRIDVKRLPPTMLTCVLSTTWHAKDLLGTHRETFYGQVMTALETSWEVPAEQRAKIAARLR